MRRSAQERALRLLEAARVLEAERDVLELVAPEHVLELLVLAPDLATRNADPSAVKRHTTFQFRLPKRSTSPTATLAKRPEQLGARRRSRSARMRTGGPR